MERYDPKSKCPKCGHDYVLSNYNPNFGSTQDVVKRTCKKCGYSWEQLPLDSKEEES